MQQGNNMLSKVEEQENTRDAENAISILARIRSEIDEEDMQQASIIVNAFEIRSCLELMLSVMETFGGYNIAAMEDMHQAMCCMRVESASVTAH